MCDICRRLGDHDPRCPNYVPEYDPDYEPDYDDEVDDVDDEEQGSDSSE